MVQKLPDSINIGQLKIKTGAQKLDVSSHYRLSIKNDYTKSVKFLQIMNNQMLWQTTKYFKLVVCETTTSFP